MAAIFNKRSKQCPRRIDIITFLPYALISCPYEAKILIIHTGQLECEQKRPKKTRNILKRSRRKRSAQAGGTSSWQKLSWAERGRCEGHVVPILTPDCRDNVTDVSDLSRVTTISECGSQSCRGVESRHTLCARKLPTDSIFTPHNKIRESRRSPVRTSYWKLIAKAKSIVRRP